DRGAPHGAARARRRGAGGERGPPCGLGPPRLRGRRGTAGAPADRRSDRAAALGGLDPPRPPGARERHPGALVHGDRSAGPPHAVHRARRVEGLLLMRRRSVVLALALALVTLLGRSEATRAEARLVYRGSALPAHEVEGLARAALR